MDAHSIETLDLALRSGLAALALFVAAILVRDHARDTAARLGAALAVGVAAYAAQSRVGFSVPPQWWQAPVLALSAGNAVIFWLFSRAIFDDDFKPRAWHAVVWLVLAGAPIVNCFVLTPTSHVAAQTLGLWITVATFGFSVLAVAQSLSTWRADLVERRRRLRIFIVAAGATYTAVATIVRLVNGAGPPSGLAGVADMLALGAIVLAVGWQLLRVSGGGMFDAQVSSPPAEVAPPEAVVASIAQPAIDPADARLIAKLEHLMTVERFHQEDGVSIGALAGRLNVPEHRLRKLINQRLGHRNFNAFLNRYRLADAKAALVDPTQSEVPVLTIAMDAGFQSLGPFNRAFKADTGLTPTEFRRLGWPKAPAESRVPLAGFEIGQ